MNVEAPGEDQVGDNMEVPVENDGEMPAVPVGVHNIENETEMNAQPGEDAVAIDHEEQNNNVIVIDNNDEAGLPNIDNMVAEVPGVVAPPEKQARLARRARKGCPICEARRSIQKLKPCGHRFCTPCIRKFIIRNCPHCRVYIDTYLPPHLMGGEAWERNIGQQLEDEFYLQAVRDRQEAFDRGEIEGELI